MRCVKAAASSAFPSSSASEMALQSFYFSYKRYIFYFSYKRYIETPVIHVKREKTPVIHVKREKGTGGLEPRNRPDEITRRRF